ncbi:tetratricopeptide repeat protein [Armatimonas sp.]|uniref:tetratricopeptide repeat protein n=1 Tax=Armatimonas sp. TaxID=1872638 RepID=UPI00286B6FF7|nr:tetratricopeptide repeat protein [Armatimonas sp.]
MGITSSWQLQQAKLLTQAQQALERYDLELAQKLYQQQQQEASKPGSLPLKIRAQIGLARVQRYRRAEKRGLALADEALAQARRSAEPQALADALLERGIHHYYHDEDPAALALLKEGLALLTKAPEPFLEARILAFVAAVQGHIGDKLTAGKTLTRMLALTQKSGDGVGDIYGLLEQGRLSESLNNTAQAQKSWLSALEKARGLSNGWLELLALYRVANSFMGLEDYPAALRNIEQAKGLLEKLPDPYYRARFLLLRATAAGSQGKTADAYPYLNQALVLAEPLDNKRMQAEVLYWLANSYYQETKLAEAQKVATQGGELSKAEGYWQQEISFLLLRAGIATTEKKNDEALARCGEALALAQKRQGADAIENQVRVYTTRASIHVSLQQLPAAHADYAEGLAVAEKGASYGSRIDLLTGEAALFYQEQQLDKTAAHYERALPLAQSAGMTEKEAETLAQLGKTYSDQNQEPKAREILQKALALYTRLNKPLPCAQVETSIGFTYMGEQNFPEARAILTRSQGRYQKLDKPVEAASVQVQIARCLAIEDSFAAARVELDTALGVFRQSNNKSAEAQALSDMGQIALQKKKLDIAIPWLESSISLVKELKLKVQEAGLVYLLSSAYGTMDPPQFDKAISLLEQAQILYQELGNRQGEGQCWYVLGQIYASRGEEARSKQCLEKAQALGYDPGK